jgi:transposase
LRQAQKIWQQYREAGLAAILEKPRKDSLGNLSSLEIARLLRYLSEFGFGTLEEAQSYLTESFGASYTIGGVSWLFKRLKVKLKTARPSNVKKDERRVEAYKKTLAV